MAVPEEIRTVKRPVNTVVVDTGNDSLYRYAVRERSGTVYVKDHNPSPRNGKTIGHIIDGKYVPVKEAKRDMKPDMLSYGGAALVKSLSQDILDDLMEVYDAKKAYTIMAIASLKVIKPSIAVSRYSTHYKRTFFSVYYPGLPLSRNSIKELFDLIGMDSDSRKTFFYRRMTKANKDHHIAIYGTLKQDNSIINDLSAFSRKARVKGSKDISIIYAYDIETNEPLCFEVFPGNSIDASNYRSFIIDNDIKSGIIVADKGFPPSKIEEELKNRPDLHFLTPLKRNDRAIIGNDMLNYEGVIEGIDRHVLYRKKKIRGGRYLYSYRDVSLSSKEEHDFLEKARTRKDFDQDRYTFRKDSFGTIVFESDMDLDPSIAYLCYDERWLLELCFRACKHDEDLTESRVQSDFTLIGSEFVNFISTIITERIIRKAIRLDLLKNISYRELLDDLNSAWRKTAAPYPPRSDDDYWVHTLLEVFEELEALGLSIPETKPEPKKRGRPAKPKEDKPKRQRGRPRKNQETELQKVLLFNKLGKL